MEMEIHQGIDRGNKDSVESVIPVQVMHPLDCFDLYQMKQDCAILAICDGSDVSWLLVQKCFIGGNCSSPRKKKLKESI
jgi:hypothetical protein